MLWSNQYIGLPYLPKGRDRKGLDCWGLHRLIQQEQRGVELPSYIDAYDHPDDQANLGALVPNEAASKWQNITPGQEQPFDVIVLRLRGVPMHIGTVVRPGVMIHVLRGVDAALENYNNATWRNRIIGFHRYQ